MRPAVQISVLLLTGAIGNSVVFVLTGAPKLCACTCVVIISYSPFCFVNAIYRNNLWMECMQRYCLTKRIRTQTQESFQQSKGGQMSIMVSFLCRVERNWHQHRK